MATTMDTGRPYFGWDEGRNYRKRKQRDYDVSSVELLHKEVVEFCDDIAPHPAEETMRNEVVRRVRRIIQSRWPGIEVKVFGSFVTGLYLPTSDIDIVVSENCLLYLLESELRRANVATLGSLKVLGKASVPIIKFVDRETEVKVDISFNKSGLKSAEKVKEYLKQYPLLHKMVLVIKQYLYLCNLNEVYSGGMGSYSVILLAVSFLQHCPKCDLDEGNLGVLLTDFFELYGKRFDYSSYGIRLDGGGSYFKKNYDNTLLIKDPADPTNLIKGAWNISNVQRAFGRAFDSLSWALKRSRGHQSPMLSTLVWIPDDVKRDRRRVEEQWGNPLPANGYRQSRPYTAIPRLVTVTPGHKMPRIIYYPS